MVAAEAAQFMSQNGDSTEITPVVVSFLINEFSNDEEMSTFLLSGAFDSVQEEVNKLI